MRKKAERTPKGPTEEERAIALRQYIEEMGLLFEYSGLPRMTGRIFAHLLISDPPQQGAEDIARAIQASRASISTMTRLLIQTGLIERQVQPGKRQDLYQMKPDAFRTTVLGKVRLLTMFRQVGERGLFALHGAPPERLERLREMHELYAFLERELPVLLERFIAERRGKRGRT